MARWVAVVGNPEMGYSIHGPFAQQPQALDWIDNQNIVEHSACVMELVAGSKGYYLDDQEEN